MLLCAFALGLGACNSSKSSSEPMRFGLNPWAGFAPLYAAQDRGLYKPVRFELPAFSTFYDIHRAFNQGSLEMAGVPLFDALQMIDEGSELKVIMITDFSNGADALVAPKSIATIKDLRGKRIGVEIGTLPHYIVLRALERGGMVEGDVQLVNVPADKAVDDFKQGKLDAAQVWEPYLSKLRSDDTHTLFTSAELPGEFPDVVVARKDVLEKRRDDLITVLRAWENVLGIWRTTPDQVEGVMARTMGMTLEELKAGAKGIVFADFAKNAELLDRSREASLWKTYERSMSFLAGHKLLKTSPRAAADVIDTSLVADAAKR